jgi:hypothetical protein
MDITAFTPQSVVVHDVPQQGSGQNVVLTDAPITLDDDLRSYFAAKVVASLGFKGLDVVADATADSTVRTAVAAIVHDPRELIDQSQALARRLNEIQDARNPAGLLAVIHGRMGPVECVAVLKLEREQGLRVRIHRAGGKLTIDMQHLRDLPLTDKTKVFKTAVLTVERGGDPASVRGRASDDQRSRFEGEESRTSFCSASSDARSP